MNRRFSWDVISSTLAVLEEGSFSAAARALGVTQPTIRRHVEELEARLGTALFSRSPVGLRPTEAASSLQPYARDVHATIEALVRIASSSGTGVRGTFRLACSEVMAVEVLPKILEPLMAKHSELSVEVVASNRNQDLLRGEADLAIRMVRPTQIGLQARRVGSVALGLYGRHDYVARCSPLENLRTMVGTVRLIGEDRGTAIIQSLNAAGQSVDRAHFGVRSDSDLVQLAAVRAGLGIGVVQVPLAARDTALVRVLPAIEGQLDLWVVTHEDLKDQMRIRVVFDHLASSLTDYATPSSTGE